MLFKQGDKGAAAYIVSAGAVGIYRVIQGQKIPLATVRKGGLFGEMAVLDGSPRLATAFAVEDSTLTVISGESMAEKTQKADPFVRGLVYMLMNNLRSVHEVYTPKSRTLLDVANALATQEELMLGILEHDIAGDAQSELESESRALSTIVKKLRRIATALRGRDSRGDAIPSDPAQ